MTADAIRLPVRDVVLEVGRNGPNPEQFDYIDVSAISRETMEIESSERHSRLTAPSRAQQPLRANDILFATIRPKLRRVALVPPQYDGAIASTAFAVLRPNCDVVDPDFLFFSVSSQPFVSAVAELQTGASYPAVRDRDVLNQFIWLPSLDIQRRISDVMKFVRMTLNRERTALLRVTELKAAVMRELFTRGLRGQALKDSEIGPIPETWRVVTLGSLGRVGNGSTPKRTDSRYWSGGHYPWLTSAKVYDREIVKADEFVTTAALEECHLPRVSAGSVLVAITGQGKTLGHAAVLRIEATVNQHIAYINIDDQDAVLPSFVRGFLETQYEFLRQVGSGGGSTKGALTCSFLRSMKIPLPADDVDGRAEQSQIVALLDAIDAKSAVHTKKVEVLESLFRSLLHKLMSGELAVSDLDLSVLPAPAEAAL